MRSLTAQLANAEDRTAAASEAACRPKAFAAQAELDQSAHAARQPAGQHRPAAAPSSPRNPSMRRGTAALGLREISLGSYVAPGQKIVWLQKIDPIYADFTVTEADYGRITDGSEGDGAVQRLAGRDASRARSSPTDARMSDASRMITVRAEARQSRTASCCPACMPMCWSMPARRSRWSPCRRRR